MYPSSSTTASSLALFLLTACTAVVLYDAFVLLTGLR
jgi:hypothetical protein